MTGIPEMPEGGPDEQAIYWLTWTTSGEDDDSRQHAFRRWLNADQAHRDAWKNANRLWQDITQLDKSDFATIGHPPDGSPNRVALPTYRRKFVRAGISMATCVLLSTLVWMSDLAFYLADYRTATGAGQHITLADGSRVQMNSETAISVDYTAGTRRLTLHGGEAWFEVAPDPKRPFEVITEYGTVRALGTAFEIDASGDWITVTVFQHAVQINLTGGDMVERLPEGSVLSFDNSIENLERDIDLSRAGAWRQHRMVFLNKQLHAVVRELNRYRKGRIIIADRALNDLPLTGKFDTNKPEEALQMIRQSLKLSEYRLTDRLVFLYRE